MRSAVYQWSWDLVSVPYEMLKEKDPSYEDKRPFEAYLEPIVSYWLYLDGTSYRTDWFDNRFAW